jgi:copper(I)-binding protein
VTRPTTRTGLLALPAVAAGLLLSGCGAGLHAQVYEPRDLADSVNVTVDDLAIRHVFVVPPTQAERYMPGEDADVELTIVSRKDEADVLIGASSPAAASVVVNGPDSGIDVPAYGSSAPGTNLVLKDLNRKLQAADYVPIVLTFQSGTTVTVNTPVAQPLTEPSPNPDFHVPETDSNGNVLDHEGE